ncbi:seven-hairpin glycosidase [Crucibulum laeve]|uniref:alpha-1,2-Mannosidase n=1 Tax=Crucibulum laeve TaxID=68775 RepID=A0A5C3M3E4_9AGAR|nr:seven-hairpin glycosidase [Crucibulum laeve]
MLPRHAPGRRAHHLAINISTPTPYRPSVFQLVVGRPLFRWILLIIGAMFGLWIFAPLLFGGGYRLHRHHRPYIPDGIAFPPPPHRPPPPPHHEGPPTVWSERADRVRDAFVHAWSGYSKYAAGYDELMPVTGEPVNNFNGWGVTLFDSLDTMWLMGLHDSFREALGSVAKSTFALKENNYAPFFETVIRYLGGLLSAYALSGEPVLLTRADDLGSMLLPAFNTTSGLPMYAVNTVSGRTRLGWSGSVLWAEALSNQMEYKYLAHLTGRTEYYNKTESIMQKMYTANHTDGLFATMWDIHKATPSNFHFSVGAYADSAHEYLLKQWLLTAQSEPKTRDLYLQSMSGILNKLLYLTPTRQLLYVTDIQNNYPTHIFEHLSCFLPGLLALGVYSLPDLSKRDKELHTWAAKGLAETCWATYFDTTTGLGPDEIAMTPGDLWMGKMEEWEAGGRVGVPPGTWEVKRQRWEAGRDWTVRKPGYLLRPEAVESFYILWKTTGDVRWRERGWSVFKAIEKYTRTKYGYASLASVDDAYPQLKDEMPSYFLAETLKYLFLLFTDEDPLSLKHWVFNTEAHPLPVFDWSPWEKEEYNITL